MHLRFFIALMALLSGTTGVLRSDLAADNGPSPRNVLMICIDDLNDWVGFMRGHPDAKTPNMDALAAEGRIFSNAHCAVPVCSPSRISVMSGVAATTHGSYELGPRYEELPSLKMFPPFRATSKNMVTPHWLEERCYITGSKGACRKPLIGRSVKRVVPDRRPP